MSATKSDEENTPLIIFSTQSLPPVSIANTLICPTHGVRVFVWERGGERNDDDYYTYRTINMGDLVTIIREIEWLSGHAALFNGALEFARPPRHYTSNKCETVFNPRPRCASGLSYKKIICFMLATSLVLLRTRVYVRKVY